MKLHSKIFSLFLCLVMLCTSVMSAPFVIFADDDEFTPAPSYYRMISQIQEMMKQRQEDIKINLFVEPYYNDISDGYERDEAYIEDNYCKNEFYNRILDDIYKTNTDDPALGDYLYNSIVQFGTDGIRHSKVYNVDDETGAYKEMLGFQITYSLHFEYYSDYEQEQKVSEFAEQFKSAFNIENASEYMKVKTIYDFIVRNTAYDEAVRSGDFSQAIETDRFRISHSAFGALYGHLISYNDNGYMESDATVTQSSYAAASFDNATKTAGNGETIISKMNQGFAVCEGYSKLFYYLCKDNGIECHIVDGDYDKSIGTTDPHEWNYVKLDDGLGDGYKWFYVDSTYSEQRSQKYLDANNYHFFLRGTASEYFALDVHPQPYHDKGTGEKEKKQLYDWYNENWNGDAAVSSIDYRFGKMTVSKDEVLRNGIVLTRLSDYGDGVQKAAYIRMDSTGCKSISLDEDGKVKTADVEGFEYNGIDAQYTLNIPYYVDDEYSYQVISGADANTNGDYYSIIFGDNSQCEIPFNVVPLNMSNDTNYDTEKTRVQEATHFNNQPVTPQVMIIDTHEHELVKGRDYDLKYYKYTNDAHTTADEVDYLQNMGTYLVSVCFKGNYCGNYNFDFFVDKALLSKAVFNTEEFTYIPIKLRKNASIVYNGQNVNVGNLENPRQIFEVGLRYGGVQLKANNIAIYKDVDYAITSYSGGINYNDEGTITLTGLASSTNLVAGDSKVLNYKVSGLYNVSQLNGTYADSNTANKYYYNGTAQKPTKFDNLDDTLVKDTEYKITGYSDCTNAGIAKVNIEGIPQNGTTGKATLYYRINQLSITDASFNYKGLNSGVISFTMTYGSRTLTKGTDYTTTQTKTSTGYTVVVKGIGNYSGSSSIDVRVSGSSTGGSSSGGTTSGGTVVSGGTTTVKTTANNTTKVVKITVNPPKITSIKSKKKKQISLVYSKPKGNISGYQVQYGLKKNFKGAKTATLKGANTRSVTIKKLKSKKKYYVRVRTWYKRNGKTYYSKWSAKKTVKIK